MSHFSSILTETRNLGDFYFPENMSLERIKTAIDAVATDMALDFVLREEQISAITHLVLKRHTLCLLPTGFGKSLIFVMTPMVLDKVST